MDARGVAASVQAKYKQLQDMVSDDETGTGAALGYQFLEKIIQIPFRLPKASPVLLARLVDGNLSPQTTENTNRQTTVVEAERLIAAAEGQGKALQEAAASVLQSRPDIPAEAVREATRNIFAKTFDDDEEVRKAIYDAVPFLEQNARKIKRFINLFRLNVLIANRRGLLERDIIKIGKLARWLTIAVRWPDFTILATDPVFLKRLGDAYSLREKSLGTSNPVNTEQGKILLAPYLEDLRIKRFVTAHHLIALLEGFRAPHTEFYTVADSVVSYIELSAVASTLRSLETHT